MNQLVTTSREAMGPTQWVSHPTTRMPGTLYNASAEERLDSMALTGEAIAAARRRRRVVREAPLVPWPYLIACVSALAILIVMVLIQRAQLVKNQFMLVDLRQAKTRALKERSEIRLSIQQLSALERVDAVSQKRLGMVRPERRLVLELAQTTAQALQPSSLGILAAKKPDHQSH